MRSIVRGFHVTSGSCHGTGSGAVPSRASPSASSERVDRAPHLARDRMVGVEREARVDREALAERLAARGGRGRERLDRRPRPLGVHVVGRERRDPAPVADAGVEQPELLGSVREVRRSLHAHVRSEHDARRRHRGEERVGIRLRCVRHRRAGLRAEVLHDHLLDVPVAPVEVADREHGLGAFPRVLSDPHEDARGERDREAAGVLDRPQPHGRMLVGRAEVRPSPPGQAVRGRLQHQPHRCADVPQPRELLVGHDAGVQVREEAGLLDHADRRCADVLERRAEPAGREPPSRDLVPLLRPVTEGEQRFLARPLATSPGDREHLLR